MDKVFKALADQTRRNLLDRLYRHNGLTLRDLCQCLDMARQSATQHLAVLEAANLVSTVWRGREKLHYLNPVPLNEIRERWINKFERPRLWALNAVKQQAEEDLPNKPEFVYGNRRSIPTFTIAVSNSAMIGPVTVTESSTRSDVSRRCWVGTGLEWAAEGIHAGSFRSSGRPSKREIG